MLGAENMGPAHILFRSTYYTCHMHHGHEILQTTETSIYFESIAAYENEVGVNRIPVILYLLLLFIYNKKAMVL